MLGGKLRFRLWAALTMSPVGIATLFRSWLRNSRICGSEHIVSLYLVKAWNLPTEGYSLESLERQQPPTLCWWVAVGTITSQEGLEWPC